MFSLFYYWALIVQFTDFTGASIASSWMENPTDKDRLLLKHHLCLLFSV